MPVIRETKGFRDTYTDGSIAYYFSFDGVPVCMLVSNTGECLDCSFNKNTDSYKLLVEAVKEIRKPQLVKL